jgi:hypothetical protein
VWEALARRLEGESSSSEEADGDTRTAPDGSEDTQKPQKEGEKKPKATGTPGLEPGTIVKGSPTPLKTRNGRRNEEAAVLEAGDEHVRTRDGQREGRKRRESKKGSSSAGQGVLQDQGGNEVVPPVHEDRAGEKKSKSKGKSKRVGSLVSERGSDAAHGQVDPRGIKGGISEREAADLSRAPRNGEGQAADKSDAAEALNG